MVPRSPSSLKYLIAHKIKYNIYIITISYHLCTLHTYDDNIIYYNNNILYSHIASRYVRRTICSRETGLMCCGGVVGRVCGEERLTCFLFYIKRIFCALHKIRLSDDDLRGVVEKLHGGKDDRVLHVHISKKKIYA